HHKGALAGVGIGALLTVVVVAGTILYTRQSGSLAAFAVHIEDLVGVGWKKSAQVPENITQDSVGQLHVRHLQRTTSRASEFLMGNPSDNSATVSTKKFPSSPPETDKPSLSNEMPGYLSSEEANKQASDAKTKAKERGSTGTFKVFSASYVRDRPRSDATITGMLEPGTRVKVQSKTGDYFRVRSLDKEPISGYVHREDAFFEPAK
ncbi:MAG: SH3 domain-containing protein, partial [Candidatus Binatia bacterium]